MNFPRYEILIRFDETTGSLKGAHFRGTSSGDAVPLNAEDWEEVSECINQAAVAGWQEATAELHQKSVDLAQALAAVDAAAEAVAAAEAAAAAAVAAANAARDQAQAGLIEHQQISDGLVAAAAIAIANDEHAALQQILREALLFGAAREAARLDAEADALTARLAEIAASKSNLFPPA